MSISSQDKKLTRLMDGTEGGDENSLSFINFNPCHGEGTHSSWLKDTSQPMGICTPAT